jgi:hypothetical protein
MRTTAMLLVLALLPGCVTGTGGPPPAPALDLMAEDVSDLGRALARRYDGQGGPPAGQQAPAQPVLRELPDPQPRSQGAGRQAVPYAVAAWPTAWVDQRQAGPPQGPASTAPSDVIPACCGVAQPAGAGDAQPAPALRLPDYDQPPEAPAVPVPTAPGGGRRALRFDVPAVACLVGPAGEALGLLLIQGGARLCAQVRPRPPEGDGGQTEAADLLFEDGTTARGVPLGAFTPGAR